ncbi:MAG: diphthine--ammonia ligase [Candidatus Thermoplasmatota archaeon]|nr:hypothetical protein [Euryarchaeota archaeon]MEC9090519.1 diphthine--ammonia ligase [Candidatus Thermoplasmatota archaeon]MED5487130.1 diphthine--ammonia ligase [Candidatus Thermoplasmatota archaeon]|tara:strand:+ start:43 stop:822 length:780 start_codon:yes stop_codon:yes gene_type:complete
MKVLVLSSGGKDSSYCVWWAMLQGWDVCGMVTVRITGEDSPMFQVPATALAGLQAASANIPWLPVSISGEIDSDIADLENALDSVIHGSRKVRSEIWSAEEISDANWPDGWKWPPELKRLRNDSKIEGVVVGALRSDYQKTRIEQMCERLGVRSYTPLWHHDPEMHMRELVSHGHDIVVTSVSAEGLDESWLGKVLTNESLELLFKIARKYRFNVDGEGGEFETSVTNSPWMRKSIQIQSTSHWTGRRGWVDIWTAELL